MASAEQHRRNLDGWGFVGESYPPPQQLVSWLSERLGPTKPLARWDSRGFRPARARALPRLPATTSVEPLDRLGHARGRGLTDLVRLRTGTASVLPDAVVRPADASQLERLLAVCSTGGVRMVPWGGGTSVTGGVNIGDDPRPVITVDLERLAGLEQLDDTSGLATFGAGTAGPAVEQALAPHGLTLGHFPQSWELSTVGGWVATRASGQESLGYGGIGDLLAGVELAAPSGRWSLAAQPATASGPDPRQLVLGSEGRLGIVTAATLRVSTRPAEIRVQAALLPDWREGLDAARDLVRRRLPLHLLRLSDEPETEAALSIGLAGRRLTASILRRWQAARGTEPPGCLLLYGAAGDGGRVRSALAGSRAVLRRHRALLLGPGPGRRWLADRFRHPYLRDSLLDLGVAVDTLETAAPWARLPRLARTVRAAIASAAALLGERCAVLTHLSHPYPDGASLYFSFFFRCPADPDAATARWASLKRAATNALLDGGGTLSHHHGVGRWHTPWLEREIGRTGLAVLGRAAAVLDPDGILSSGVLLDPRDRLEE